MAYSITVAGFDTQQQADVALAAFLSGYAIPPAAVATLPALSVAVTADGDAVVLQPVTATTVDTISKGIGVVQPAPLTP